tara:strand:+ start:40 stop:864 length:825 start_codon:yes stop_codon:yes gene_type:complete
MSVITPGTTFANGEQLTASDLNLLVQGASFSQNAVDNDTTILVGSAITVADGGITSAKLDADAVTTSKILNGEVTKAKIEDVADYKVLGNVSGAAAAPQEVAILDEDDMASNSDTSLATQQSIKAYVDSSSGILQTALAITTSSVSTTTTIPRDNTTPRITEGVSAGLDVTMTPISTSSTIRATLTGLLGNSDAGQYMVITIFEGNTCVGVSQIQQPSQGNDPINATFYFNPASASQQTYSVRMGNGSSGSVGFNTSPTFGGLNKVTLFLEELA